MHNTVFGVRAAQPHEYAAAGRLLVDVYSRLDGFPGPDEQPEYYAMLANAGNMVALPSAELIVACTNDGAIAGAVVYFGNMQYYGSGGTATSEKDAAGFRLLAVDHGARGLGIGKQLALACIEKAKQQQRQQLIIHTTMAMQTAWSMYEKLGFIRSQDLDFMQGSIPVFGFRLQL